MVYCSPQNSTRCYGLAHCITLLNDKNRRFHLFGHGKIGCCDCQLVDVLPGLLFDQLTMGSLLLSSKLHGVLLINTSCDSAKTQKWQFGPVACMESNHCGHRPVKAPPGFLFCQLTMGGLLLSSKLHRVLRVGALYDPAKTNADLPQLPAWKSTTEVMGWWISSLASPQSVDLGLFITFLKTPWTVCGLA